MTPTDVSPTVLIGSRLATEPGRGRRAVPVRSALIGAIAGVLGVVGCFTFRQGLIDTVENNARSGVVWDYAVAAEGQVTPKDAQTISNDRTVAAALDARWGRAVRMEGTSVPVFGTEPLRGEIPFVLTDGRAPENDDEIAFASRTADQLGVRVGDTVEAGPKRTPTRVVGIAMLPTTSHTEYDQSGWMTMSGLEQRLQATDAQNPAFFEDYLLIRWKPGADTSAAEKRFAQLNPNYYTEPAARPVAVTSLGGVRSLPYSLAVFFGLLGCATVAHALVTTVRRRRQDLAVLRSMGFTRGNARGAIAWQSTMLAVAGLIVGVPLGIVVGRFLWRQLAESYPVVYVAPLAVAAVLLVIPLAIAIANLLAAGPAHAATRLSPAKILRTE